MDDLRARRVDILTLGQYLQTDVEPPCRSSAGCIPTSSRAIANGDSSAASSKWRRDRWCVRAIAPIGFWRRTISAFAERPSTIPIKMLSMMPSFADTALCFAAQPNATPLHVVRAADYAAVGAPNSRSRCATGSPRPVFAAMPARSRGSDRQRSSGRARDRRHRCAVRGSAICRYRLPPGDYRADTLLTASTADLTVLGWGLGAYRYTRYKAAERAPARLVVPKCVRRIAAARPTRRDRAGPRSDQHARVRHVAGATRAMPRPRSRKSSAPRATSSSATICSKQNFPTIHAVGRASANAPRLIDLNVGQRRRIRASR